MIPTEGSPSASTVGIRVVGSISVAGTDVEVAPMPTTMIGCVDIDNVDYSHFGGSIRDWICIGSRLPRGL